MENKWYILRTVTGKEKKAKEQLQSVIKEEGIDHLIKEIIIPMEKTFYLRKGKRVIVERNHYPGYIFVQMSPVAIGELKSIGKQTNFVAGFLGGDKPIPMRDIEVEQMLKKLDDFEKNTEPTNDFKIGESIKITDGPFKDFNGDITNISEDRTKFKVSVKIFGRPTPIELSIGQLERVY